MTKLRCAIVEDDDIALILMASMADKTGVLDVKGKFNSPIKAASWLSENEIDLLFLDVEMPGMTGLEMLRSLAIKPEVIVVSANPNYAIEAYDLSVTDYLLKPVKDYSRFLMAVNKVLAKQKSKSQKSQTDDNLFVKVDSLLHKIDMSTIQWVEASGDYVKIQTEEKTYVVYSTLKNVEEKLDPSKFVRVHRSYVINISKITNIDLSNLEIGKKIIPISGTYKDDLLGKIKVL
jgi:DNA-binding LytR/AlgR family response regulator